MDRMVKVAERLELIEYTKAESKAIEILSTIQTKAPIAIGKMIDCINTAVSNGTSGYDKEATSFGDCFNTEDMKEGTTAFIEKRKAIFKGK
jgi:enoyl-CoA hydratase